MLYTTQAEASFLTHALDDEYIAADPNPGNHASQKRVPRSRPGNYSDDNLYLIDCCQKSELDTPSIVVFQVESRFQRKLSK